MILSIQLSTTACDPGCNRTYEDTFYISPQTLEEGVRVDYCLPSQYHGFISPIHTQTLSDGTGVEIQSADYGDRILKAGDGRTYCTPRIGLSYAYCELTISLIPPFQPVWDELHATWQDVTSSFARGELAQGTSLRQVLEQRGDDKAGLLPFTVPYMTHNAIQLTDERNRDTVFVFLDKPRTFKDVHFELVSHSVQLNDWDPDAACPRRFLVDSRQWEASCDDAKAALAVAESIAGQMPEALEIIARYMTLADDLGSADAHAWLADYYGATDSKYDPYV